jgi:SPP1 family predicted phage head-tail adaptor
MALSLAQDTFGGTVIDQENVFATVWASVEALSGRELYSAQQKVSEVTHLITIRWLAGVKARMNVWFDDRQFQIQAVENPDERRHFLRLLCIERDDSALEAAGTAP